MKRRIVTVLVILGVAFVIWLTSPAPEFGEAQCQVCGKPASFVAGDPATDTTLEFCEKHGQEYREREGGPERPK
jgi:hypothetical protein